MDQTAWLAYWQQRDQPWRTEPEIDESRQAYLAKRRASTPDAAQGIYPFKDIKLSRADVEWLLSTHEGGRGPVEWSDESQRDRVGLDLRGADVRHVNLSGLPLARLCGGFPWSPKSNETVEQLSGAAIALESADLRKTHLEGANLRGGHLQQADLRGAHLERADLSRAHLEGANLRDAHLEGAVLIQTSLVGAALPNAHLEGARLIRAHLEGVHLREAHLEGADLRRAFLDSATNLDGTLLSSPKDGRILLADLHWSDANLTLVNWQQVTMLGDERRARLREKDDGTRKSTAERLKQYEDAVRANRQLALVLQAQGLSEDAARFAYRAELLQRIVWRRERKFGRYFFSLVLDAVAGYGYRPGRCLAVYLLALAVFTVAHYLIGVIAGPHLTWLSALATSVQSLHGRVFSFQVGDPQTLLNTVEAFVGLFIEAIVVAVITQRILGK